MADRGHMEAETGMSRIYGYPDPNTGNAFHNEPGRLPQSTTTGAFGSGHTTGTGPGTGLPDQDYYGRGDVGRGAGRDVSGYGADDGSGRPGAQNFEQQPAIDRNMEMRPSTDPRGGGLSPNRGPPQTAGPEGGWSPTSQAGTLTPVKQRVGRDFPPELPPRPQATQLQAADNDQRGQMYQ